MHVPDRADELEDFKSQINLTAYMATRGYELNAKASSRNSAVMINGQGDKLVVGKSPDSGHWIYFSVRDMSDNGSIVDFEQGRSGCNLGELRRRLRPLLMSPPAPPPTSYADSLEPLSRDLMKVRAELSGMYDLMLCRPFLQDVRGIPAAVLDADRFAGGRILSDKRTNAVFPHWNREGICGYELKNKGFTGFSPGGMKGLWGSLTQPEDEKLVVAETALDALSYAALFGVERSRFVSTGGQFNPDQPELIVGAARKLAEPRAQSGDSPVEVVIAFDNDAGGHQMAAQLTPLLAEAVGAGAVRFHHPDAEGFDWNDALKAS